MAIEMYLKGWKPKVVVKAYDGGINAFTSDTKEDREHIVTRSSSCMNITATT